MTAHSRIVGGSTAKRVMNCPGSVALVATVPPSPPSKYADEGTLLLFRNDPNAWHGFEPFAGPRRVIQLNWVTDESVVRREQARHRVSAFFKRLLKKTA